MAEPTARFEIYADRLGEWRFRYCCSESQPRLRASEGYSAKVNALKAVESLRRNAPIDARYDFKVNSRGRHFFTLRARNGNILAVSRNHVDEDDLHADVAKIRAEIEDAQVVEREATAEV